MNASERAARVNQLAAVDDGSLTGVKASAGDSRRVHIAFAEGSFDSYPVCDALGKRDVETTDELANCPDCKSLCRAAGVDLYNLFDGIGDDYDPTQDRHGRYAG